MILKDITLYIFVLCIHMCKMKLSQKWVCLLLAAGWGETVRVRECNHRNNNHHGDETIRINF